MRGFVKMAGIALLRIVLRTLWLLPVKKNRVLFISNDGARYACNPKYVYRYLRGHGAQELDMVWVFDRPQDYAFLAEEGVTLVKNDSFSFIYQALTAQVLVINDSMPSYIPLRKKQCLLNTWHGGGAYKKVFLDTALDAVKKKVVRTGARQTTWFVSSCARFTEVMTIACGIPASKFLPCGMPRNDCLFALDTAAADNVYDRYAIPRDTKLVLYAPTFRGDIAHATCDTLLDIPSCLQALTARFGGKWCFLYRAHQLLVRQGAAVLPGQVINVSDYDDMQELLAAAQVLITDYSSCMWDFSLTGKPCFLYATDVAAYQQERDFYTPMSEWPFALGETNDALAGAIAAFDETAYADSVRRHHEALGSYETGHASRVVGEKIRNVCLTQRKKEDES